MMTVHYYDAATEKKVPKDAIVLSEHVREVLDALAVADRALDMSGSPLSATRSILRVLADQIEAQIKPPRIPEPGLWGIVEARNTGDKWEHKWIRISAGRSDGCVWEALGNLGESWSRVTTSWEGLTNPVLIREGVDS